MEILLPELKRIFQKAPVGIVAVLVMDIAEIVLLSLILLLLDHALTVFLTETTLGSMC